MTNAQVIEEITKAAIHHFKYRKPGVPYDRSIIVGINAEGEKPSCSGCLFGKSGTRKTLVTEFGLGWGYANTVITARHPLIESGRLTLHAKPMKAPACIDQAWTLTMACRSHGYTLRIGYIYGVELDGKRYYGYPFHTIFQKALEHYKRGLGLKVE